MAGKLNANTGTRGIIFMDRPALHEVQDSKMQKSETQTEGHSCISGKAVPAFFATVFQTAAARMLGTSVNMRTNHVLQVMLPKDLALRSSPQRNSRACPQVAK